MIKRVIHAWVVILLLAILSGTVQASRVSSFLDKYDPATYSIIYGRIDTSGCDYHLCDLVTVQIPLNVKLSPCSVSNQAQDYILDQDFFLIVVKPGEYFLYQLRTAQQGMFGSSLFTTFENVTTIKTDCPGNLGYWGNCTFVRTTNPGFRTLGHFEVKQTGDPREIDVLAHFLENAKGTKWEQIVADKLEQTQNGGGTSTQEHDTLISTRSWYIVKVGLFQTVWDSK